MLGILLVRLFIAEKQLPDLDYCDDETWQFLVNDMMWPADGSSYWTTDVSLHTHHHHQQPLTPPPPPPPPPPPQSSLLIEAMF